MSAGFFSFGTLRWWQAFHGTRLRRICRLNLWSEFGNLKNSARRKKHTTNISTSLLGMLPFILCQPTNPLQSQLNPDVCHCTKPSGYKWGIAGVAGLSWNQTAGVKTYVLEIWISISPWTKTHALTASHSCWERSCLFSLTTNQPLTPITSANQLLAYAIVQGHLSPNEEVDVVTELHKTAHICTGASNRKGNLIKKIFLAGEAIAYKGNNQSSRKWTRTHIPRWERGKPVVGFLNIQQVCLPQVMKG